MRDPRDRPTLAQKALTGIAWLFYRTRFADAARQAAAIRASGLHYVLVRATSLTDKPARGDYRVGYLAKGVSSIIARADVVDFMLKQLEDDSYLGQMPFLSY